ncbi:carbohydrate ABC transporter permease [Thermoanaerobacterium aotearoense]|uniref:carbohydrate ABC transporter permease n=1 Tax=Thermoanaerobacterium aotearoense TaxID=47490 RepID=UPI001F469FE1|nr:carbohydrate ABC transporter permease [Thermoanaerobacterium aotearoense]
MRWLIKRILLYLVNFILIFIVVFPIIYAISVSFMPNGEAFQYPPKLIPDSFYLGNYIEALKSVPILRFISNSFIVSIIVTIGQILTSSLAAYAFTFYEFKGKNIIFAIFLSTMMIPAEAIIIANYLTIRQLGLLNTYAGLILPYLSSALGIFLLRQFYLTIPKDYYEAAQLDGCTRFGFLIKVVMPLSRPAIGSLAVYSFLMTWNQYMWPLLITNTDDMRTVQIGISMLQWSDSQSFGLIMAGVIMILIPSIMIFIFGQKQLVDGLNAGALKG